jgi:hypothetical protein
MSACYGNGLSRRLRRGRRSDHRCLRASLRARSPEWCSRRAVNHQPPAPRNICTPTASYGPWIEQANASCRQPQPRRALPGGPAASRSAACHRRVRKRPSFESAAASRRAVLRRESPDHDADGVHRLRADLANARNAGRQRAGPPAAPCRSGWRDRGCGRWSHLSSRRGLGPAPQSPKLISSEACLVCREG